MLGISNHDCIKSDPLKTHRHINPARHRLPFLESTLFSSLLTFIHFIPILPISPTFIFCIYTHNAMLAQSAATLQIIMLLYQSGLITLTHSHCPVLFLLVPHSLWIKLYLFNFTTTLRFPERQKPYFN